MGARWNSPGHRIVYAARSFAGAILEKLVHTNTGETPDNDVSVELSIPEGVSIEELEDRYLPPDWRTREDLTRALGDRWHSERRTAVLIVPSAVAGPNEKNLLINQDHTEFARITSTDPEPVDYDPRLFRPR